MCGQETPLQESVYGLADAYQNRDNFSKGLMLAGAQNFALTHWIVGFTKVKICYITVNRYLIYSKLI